MQKHTIAPLLAKDPSFLCLFDDHDAGVMPFKIKYCLLTRMELKRKGFGLNRSGGMALMLAVLTFNLLGDGLRDIVDPRQRT